MQMGEEDGFSCATAKIDDVQRESRAGEEMEEE